MKDFFVRLTTKGPYCKLDYVYNGHVLRADELIWLIDTPKKQSKLLTDFVRKTKMFYIGGTFHQEGALYALSMDELNSILTGYLGLDILALQKYADQVQELLVKQLAYEKEVLANRAAYKNRVIAGQITWSILKGLVYVSVKSIEFMCFVIVVPFVISFLRKK